MRGNDLILKAVSAGEKSIRTIKNAATNEEHYVMLLVCGSCMKKNHCHLSLLIAHCRKPAVAADLDIVRTAAR